MKLRPIAKSAYHALPPVIGEPLKHAYHRIEEALESSMVHKEVADPDGEVMQATRQIRRLAASHRGEKLLVDCGFNNGLVLKTMLKHLPDFQAYGFEVNDQVFAAVARRLQRKHPQILSLDFAAVSDRDGQSSYQQMGNERGVMPAQGTTIVEGLAGHILGEVRPVNTIDFSNWLQASFVRHTNGAAPFIAVKMDIEGAEYDVLEHMVEDGSIGLIGYLACEFHSRRWPENERHEILEREQELRARFKEHPTLHFDEWI